MTNEKRKILNGTLRYVFLIIMALFVLVPVLWMVSTAFKTEAETYSPTPIWIPSEISLASFKKFFGIYNFGSMTMNSLVTCLGSMIICTVFSCLAGYGVTRFNFKGKKSFLGFLLVTQMFPSVMLVVPFYSMLTKYHMTNTLFGLIIVYAATNIAFSTWMMTSYFKTIPTELDEAARVDGANSFTIFWKIILPLLKPAIVTSMVLKGVGVYNEYYCASLYLQDKRTLGVVATSLYTFTGPLGSKYNLICAGVLMSLLPALIVFLLCQKQIYSGIAAGAVKG